MICTVADRMDAVAVAAVVPAPCHDRERVVRNLGVSLPPSSLR